jgi:hypothetical protein
MKGRDEHNLIPVFENVIAFALKFPISIVDQNEDPWAADDAMSIYHPNGRNVGTYTVVPSMKSSSRSLSK